MNNNYRLDELISFIELARSILDKSELSEVEHYLNHGEYEMAFEGLVIELMRSKRYPDKFDFPKWKELALYYKLNEHSVFDGNFWSSFLAWGSGFKG